MFDTHVTIVGNVLTAPEWRRTTQSGTLVANFKVASTARRLDRESGRWVDGNSLRVRVNCWRKLAEGVASSLMVGDPVVLVGRMYTRDWTDDAGNHRIMYELEAVAVGHDLSRGRGRFSRNRPAMSTSSVEDAEAEARVHGETTESVSAQDAPALPNDRSFDDDGENFGVPTSPGPGFDLGHITPDGFDGRPDLDDLPHGDGELDERGGDGVPGELRGAGEPAGPSRAGVASDPDGDDGDEGDGDEGDGDHGGLASEADTPSPRGRRGRGRVPVPA